MYIGKFRHNIKDVSVAKEYQDLSEGDEKSAMILAAQNQYRQACYLLLQAMEKAIRAKIFSFVNPNIEYFREENKSHSIESAIKTLVSLGKDEYIKTQIEEQISKYVLKEANYAYMHNNLRYPTYSKKYNSYLVLDVNIKDFNELKDRLYSLRKFLMDIDKVLR